MTWEIFLRSLLEAGGSTDMQTSKTGRYPWLFHFCREQSASLVEVEIYAHKKTGGVLKSPLRDWHTKDLILADYQALKDHGGYFNDTADALRAKDAAP